MFLFSELVFKNCFLAYDILLNFRTLDQFMMKRFFLFEELEETLSQSVPFLFFFSEIEFMERERSVRSDFAFGGKQNDPNGKGGKIPGEEN